MAKGALNEQAFIAEGGAEDPVGPSHVPPHITDDVVASAMLQAKRDGITGSEQIGGVALSGDRLWISGTIPGFRSAVDISAQAPPLQETAQQTQAFNQQREQQLAMEASQREQQQAQGRVSLPESGADLLTRRLHVLRASGCAGWHSTRHRIVCPVWPSRA